MNWKRFLGLLTVFAGIFTLTPASIFAQDNATPSFADTDVVIDEVFYVGTSSTDWIQIQNTGATTIDVSTWWLCSRFSYGQLNTFTLQPGDDLSLSPGETVRFRPSFNLNNTSADLGIYTSPSFSSAAAMVDFVQWGTNADVGRPDVAVAKGIWRDLDLGVGIDYDFIPTAAAGQSTRFDGSNSGGGLLTHSADFSSGTPTVISLQSTNLSLNTTFYIVLLSAILLLLATTFIWRQNKIR